jgi:cystathionine beta-lyase/cystathionine gamma-synthase
MYQNSTYAFRDYDHVDAWRAGQAPHFIYQREGNPTVRCFELKLADLEGAEAAAAGANGMAVIGATLLELCTDGGTLIASNELYEVATNVLCRDLPQEGINVVQVDITDLAAVEAACTPGTRAIYCETFSNPALKVADIEALADVAHRHDAALVVDNTFLSPALLRPLEYGADIVLHSATKYLAGHGQVMGGVAAGSRSQIAPIASRMSRFGGVMSPFAAWLMLIGVKTLPLRMERHAATTARLAGFLARHPAVERVNFPGLPDDPGHGAAARLVDNGYGGLLSFTLKSGCSAVRDFVDGLDLFTIAVSLGEYTSLVWPYPDGLIRLAVGLEDAADLEADLDAALQKIGMG